MSLEQRDWATAAPGTSCVTGGWQQETRAWSRETEPLLLQAQVVWQVVDSRRHEPGAERLSHCCSSHKLCDRWLTAGDMSLEQRDWATAAPGTSCVTGGWQQETRAWSRETEPLLLQAQVVWQVVDSRRHEPGAERLSHCCSSHKLCDRWLTAGDMSLEQRDWATAAQAQVVWQVVDSRRHEPGAERLSHCSRHKLCDRWLTAGDMSLEQRDWATAAPVTSCVTGGWQQETWAWSRETEPLLLQSQVVWQVVDSRRHEPGAERLSHCCSSHKLCDRWLTAGDTSLEQRDWATAAPVTSCVTGGWQQETWAWSRETEPLLLQAQVVWQVVDSRRHEPGAERLSHCCSRHKLCDRWLTAGDMSLEQRDWATAPVTSCVTGGWQQETAGVTQQGHIKEA